MYFNWMKTENVSQYRYSEKAILNLMMEHGCWSIETIVFGQYSLHLFRKKLEPPEFSILLLQQRSNRAAFSNVNSQIVFGQYIFTSVLQ